LDNEGYLDCNIKFELMHQTVFWPTPTPLGECEFDVNLMCGDDRDTWTKENPFTSTLQLNKSGRMDSVQGKLSVQFYWNQPPLISDPTEDDLLLDMEVGEGEGEEADGDAPSMSSKRASVGGKYNFGKQDDVLEEFKKTQFFEENNDTAYWLNELTVQVIKAENLQAVDSSMFGGPSYSDPFVKIRISDGLKKGYAKKNTTVKEKNLEPVWRETFRYECTEDDLYITFKVFDSNDYRPPTFLGQATLNGRRDGLLDMHTHEFTLDLQDREGGSAEDRGKLYVACRWSINPDPKKLSAVKELRDKGQKKGMFHKMGQFLGVVEEDSEDDDDGADKEEDYGGEESEEEKEEKTDEEKAAEKEEAMNALNDIEIKEGDWQVQVHLIEARDLKAENYDGTSDPVVYVECFGQRQNTAVIYNQTTCVFDELLIFNMKDLKKEEFEEGIIRVSVMDYNIVTNKMIGQCTFDAASVYTGDKHHELYREWVGLIDDTDADDVGVQGYLKLTITLLGPGDKPFIHDEAAELKEEQKKEQKAGGDVSQLMLSVPMVRKEWKFLETKIYQCSGLPVMDGAGLASKAGTDAYCSLNFAGAKPVRTKPKTVKSADRREISPIIFRELWYPISIPTMTKFAQVGVWDHDDTKQELIGKFNVNVMDVMKNPDKYDARWYNMYGSHEFKTDGALKTAGKIFGEMKKAIKTMGGVEVNWYKLYNNVPAIAPSYKGRVLIDFKMQKERPPSKDTEDVKPFRMKIPDKEGKMILDKFTAHNSKMEAKYCLKAFVISGTEVPTFTVPSSSLRVKVSIGLEELITPAAKPQHGYATWGKVMESQPFKMPKDPNMLPDIFVYLLNANDRPVCFYRRRAVDVVHAQTRESDEVVALPGFFQECTRIYMEEDKQLDCLDAGEFPGSLLVKIGFGLARDAQKPEVQQHWKDLTKFYSKRKGYHMRVHLYQARGLPSSDSNGLADPYVKVAFQGRDRDANKTRVVEKNLYPAWYQTICFPDIQLADHNNYEFCSQVALRVFDQDNLDSDDYMGMAAIDLQEAFHCASTVPASDFPDPVWKPIFYEKPGDSVGDILVSIQLIQDEDNNVEPLPDFLAEKPPGYKYIGVSKEEKHRTMNAWRQKKADNEKFWIKPDGRRCFLEVIVLGIRNIAPYHFRSMSNPFLEMRLDSLGNTYEANTEPSKHPDPDNPNYLKRMVIPVTLPEKSLFASPLQLTVKDRRLGGFLKPVVGTGCIDLMKKIPWCKDTFEPPQSQMFDEQAAQLQSGNESSAAADDDAAAVSSAEEEKAIADFEARHTRDVHGNIIMHDEDEEELIEEEVTNPDGTKGVKRSLVKISKDAAGVAIARMRSERKIQEEFDDFIVNPDPPNVDQFLTSRLVPDEDEDTGAGIFGAMRYVHIEGLKDPEINDGMAHNVDWSEDDTIPDPDWMIGREKLEGDLEEELKTTPFETYDLHLGKAGMQGTFFGHTLRKTGVFKGLIRIMENESDPPMFNEQLMDQLLKPKPYKVRLYLIEADKLADMDMDITGKPAASDPYVKIKLGKWKFSDRKNALDNSKHADLYQMHEINAELPGASQLTIEMMDKDTIGSDDLIGRTVVDLEDRWFDARWQELGKENMKLPGETTEEGDDKKVRWCTKPIEQRVLTLPSTPAFRGSLQCWVDIMTPEVAAAFPPDNITLPAKQIFEVRLVIWKAKDVPAMDSFENMSDLYVRAWPEGCDPQETDTHWRAKKGKASWNWRLKYDVELGHNTRAMKFPYLYIQLWDRDLLKYSDCAGEVVFNLGKYYQKAYRRNLALKLFEEKKGAAATNARKQKKYAPIKVIDEGKDTIKTEAEQAEDERIAIRDKLIEDMESADASDDAIDDFIDETETNDAGTGPDEATMQQMMKDIMQKDVVAKEEEKKREEEGEITDDALPQSDSNDNEGDIQMGNLYGNQRSNRRGSTFETENPLSNSAKITTSIKADAETPAIAPASSAKAEAKKAERKAAKNKKDADPEGCWPFNGKKEEEKDDENTPLLDDAGVKTEAEAEADDEEEMKENVNMFKNMTGLWDIDPPDSAWINFTNKDHNTDKVTPMGSVAISLQVWPKEKVSTIYIISPFPHRSYIIYLPSLN
jgi:hypothetical protein